MKNIFIAFLLASSFSLIAQNPLLAPFYHGVASGDALSDKVIIWTRVSDTTGSISVDWKVATDTLLANVVQSGTATTDSTKDFTLKVDVTGLQSDSWYYYQFTFNGKKSLIGRTKTLPVGNNQRIRVAIVSCAEYDQGVYFNAYLSVARRNDIQAVVHLGDYIYEYPGGDVSGFGNERLPAHECLTLDDYRQRYSSYRLDPYLMQLHQQYPFYCVWDDHERANNSWSGGAENHTPGTEGNWLDRVAAGNEAYFEWIPIRETSPGSYNIHRTFNFGGLADFIMLDTRLEGRDEQATTAGGAQDTTRTILGSTQRQWFFDQLSNSQARWKIIGQQVMFAPLLSFLYDQWDGYVGDRNRVIRYVMNNNIQNVVMLTGDIHSCWANDVPQPGVTYNTNTGAGSAFVEIVSSSITSDGSPIPLDVQTIQLIDPHVKYAELVKKGYAILDIDTNRVQSDFVHVGTDINQFAFTDEYDASWYVNNGERFLREAPGHLTDYTNPVPFAPLTVDNTNTGVYDIASNLPITIFPNPFGEQFYVTVKEQTEPPVTIRLFNLLGKMVYELKVEEGEELNSIKINTLSLPAGNYLLSVESGAAKTKVSVTKAQ